MTYSSYRYQHPGGYGYVHRRDTTSYPTPSYLKDVAAERVRVGFDPAVAGSSLLWSYDDGYVVYTESSPYDLNRPTTEESTMPDTDTDTDTEPATTAPDVLRVTLATLRALDACSPYLRRFGEEFPESRFPDGVPLDEATCHRYYRSWDWDWARNVMLTDAGQREWYRRVEDGSRASRDRFGSGDARRARVTGHLLETRPDYRSERLLTAGRTAVERADERVVATAERGRRAVAEARQQVKYWTTQLAEREAALPELEARVAPALARRVRRQVEALEAEVASLTAQLTERRTAYEVAQAELERLAALDPPTEGSATDAPTGDPTDEVARV